MKITTLFIVLLFILNLISPSPGFTQEATSAGDLDPTLIKENVKQRIREVVKGENTQKPQAITGRLISIANATLTLETLSGPSLASISATTTYARLPGSSKIDLADIAIDDYIIALGFINDTQVLDTRRILTQKAIPQPSVKKTFFGVISDYDNLEYTFTLTNQVTGEAIILTDGRKSKIDVQVDLDQTIPFDPRDPLPETSCALATYTTDEEENLISSMLIKTNCPLSQDSALDQPMLNSTTSSQLIPPELRH